MRKASINQKKGQTEVRQLPPPSNTPPSGTSGVHSGATATVGPIPSVGEMYNRWIEDDFVVFTDCVYDPILGWLEHLLSQQGIPYVRLGPSHGAPIMWVASARLADAAAILDRKVEILYMGERVLTSIENLIEEATQTPMVFGIPCQRSLTTFEMSLMGNHPAYDFLG